MIIKPLYIMKGIFGLLEVSPKISFHSNFENSFNLKVNNIIINISTNKTTLPPYGIVLSEIDFMSVKREVDSGNVNIKIKENIIHINKLEILVEDASSIYISDIIINKNAISNMIIEKLKEIVILSRKENGFNLNNEVLLNSIIYRQDKFENEHQDDIKIFTEKLNDLKLFFRDKADIEILKYFLGRGKGLTPAGDDFLVGAVALFYSTGIYERGIYNIKHFIYQNTGIYTNDISEQFLILATEGKFSRSIIRLIEELKEQKISSDTINNVIKYGGTSGTDILLGIIWANTTLMEGIYE